MSNFSTWQFIRQYAGVAAVISTGFLALGIIFLIHHLQRTNVQRQKLQRMAVCWLATLAELSLALDRMRETTRRLIRDRQRPSRAGINYKSEIHTHRWLREGFLLMAGDQAGASIVGSLNRDCDFFVWNLNQTTNARVHMLGSIGPTQMQRDKFQDTIEEFDDATIAFACNNHHGMVGEWKKSVALLDSFCCQHHLERGVGLSVPGEFPEKWQRNDAKLWTIETLPQVGEDNWEP